ALPIAAQSESKARVDPPTRRAGQGVIIQYWLRSVELSIRLKQTKKHIPYLSRSQLQNNKHNKYFPLYAHTGLRAIRQPPEPINL
ncbi:hypothetical protein, partial [Treponema sp. R80B11-R83G3]